MDKSPNFIVGTVLAFGGMNLLMSVVPIAPDNPLFPVFLFASFVAAVVGIAMMAVSFKGD